jgi:CHAT domain-containing protein/tetratricopeptide (TPR) repeat protein
VQNPTTAHISEQALLPVSPSRDKLLDDLAVAVQLVQQSPSEAITCLERIAEIGQQRNDDELIGRASYAAARANVHLGRLGDALGAIDVARTHLHQAGFVLESIRTDLGRMHILDDLGRSGEAIEVGHILVDAVDAEHRAGVEEASYIRAAALENLGVSNGYLGRNEAALAAYQLAEAGYAAINDTEGVMRSLANRGVELVELGRCEEALRALRTASVAFDQTDDVLFAAKCSAFAARAHLQLGDFAGSLRAIDRAAELLVDQDVTTEYARTELVRAETLASLNLIDDALRVYLELIDRFQSAGLLHDTAVALNGRGQLLVSAGRDDEAHECLDAALSLLIEVDDPPLESAVRIGLSWCCGEPSSALEHARSAMVTATNSGRPVEELVAAIRLCELAEQGEQLQLLERAHQLVNANQLPHLSWQVLLAQARYHRAVGDPDAGQRALEQAADIVEQLRVTVHDERARIPFMGSRRSVHVELQQLLLDRGDHHAAFDRSQRSRARTLIETRRQDHASPAPVVATVAPNSAEVTFEILGDEVVAFVRAPGTLTVARHVTSMTRLRVLIERLHADLRRRSQTRNRPATPAGRHQAATVQTLQDLYLEMFGPIADQLEVAALRVIPTGLLANVPFSALHDGVGHLVERMVIGITPSVLMPERQAVPVGVNVRRLVLGVADKLAPGIAEEAYAVGRIGPASLLLDAAATAEALRTLGPDHDVIHIACHGVNRPDAPQLAALRLGDGWLTAQDVSDIELTGQLVVLSGCSTGRQHAVGGAADEVVGLPRAFLRAGASGVIVNHWPVDDVAAVDLMTGFHHRLADTDPLSALRHAQLDALARDPDPYLWAPAFGYGCGLPTTQLPSISLQGNLLT